MIDITHFGAVGDGISDNSAAIQKALDQGGNIRIPTGVYRVSRTLYVGSRTAIHAAPGAVLLMDEHTPKCEGDFLLAAREGSQRIGIFGGVWDGNFALPHNTKPSSIFAPKGWSGVALNFVGVQDLTLEDMEIANSVTYNLRLSRVEDFRIRHIAFSARERAFNQDGVHLGGGCRRGHIEDIRAVSKGQTNDDLLALNADDSVERIENRGLSRDAIEDIYVDGLFAEDCHTVIRVLSVDAPIRRIHIQNVTAGCRCYALNLDAARYCATPLFTDGERPDGVGVVEDVAIENFTYWATGGSLESPMMIVESLCDRLALTGIRRDTDRDLSPERAALSVGKVTRTAVTVDGVRTDLPTFDCRLDRPNSFSELRMQRL